MRETRKRNRGGRAVEGKVERKESECEGKERERWEGGGGKGGKEREKVRKRG